MSSYNDCIKFFLDIQDPNIVFEKYFYDKDDPKVKIYQAVLVQPACPECGSVDLLHNGRLKTRIKYITANASQPIIIELFKQRVICRDCHKRSMAQSSLVDKYCCISNISKQKVLSALTEDRSMTSIARENNVSINTVQRILGGCYYRFLDDYEHLPEHLAFDEFKGVDSQLHFICLDGKTCLNTLASSLLKLGRTLKQLQWILISIIKISLEHAFLTLKLSSIALLTRSFKSLRVHVMKSFKKSEREYKLLKSPWKLYLKKYDDLDKVHPHYNWHYKDFLTQEQVVMEGIGCSEELENSYNLMQDFIKALNNGDTAKLKELIHSKDSVGYLMHKTLLTFKHNLKAILNGAKLSFSNGCIEGFNRKIKQIERTAFGYSSFINLLARIRLEENTVKEKESNNYMVA